MYLGKRSRVERKQREIRNLLCGRLRMRRDKKVCAQIASGAWPMHEVVPRAVSAAVRMLTMT